MTKYNWKSYLFPYILSSQGGNTKTKKEIKLTQLLPQGPYLQRINHADGLTRGYGGEDDDSHRAISDQWRRSEGQENAHAPLHGDYHGQTPRTEEKTPVKTRNVAMHQPLPPCLKVRPEAADQAVGAGQRVGEDEHHVDQGQTEQAQVHSVL